MTQPASLTKEIVNDFLDTLVVDTHHFPDTNYTVAILKNPVNGFVVAQGMSSIVPGGVPFDPKAGVDFAVADARRIAMDNIFSHYRYHMFAGF